MASAASFIPPVELIPLCWWLEIAASALLIRGNWQNAQKKTVLRLSIGTLIGLPLGLLLTTNVPLALSQNIALLLIMVLATLLLIGLRLKALHKPLGTVFAGIGAGLGTGLASVGGMVVAIFMLSFQGSATTMRATVILFLLLSSGLSVANYFLFDVMTQIAVFRGIFFIIPAIIGVHLGTKLFIPKWEHFYRPFCLTLLIILSGTGLVRLIA